MLPRLLFWMLLMPFSAPAASPLPQPRAHSHNDYLRERPLHEALENGFRSVEADIHLVNGQLLVAHDLDKTQANRTLQSLYLDPLMAHLRKNSGKVYPHAPEFILLIDIKSEAEATYQALRQVLSTYRPILTRFSDTNTELRAVTVVLSGNRPTKTVASEPLRYASIDGRLPDLEKNVSTNLVRMVSDNWRGQFTWTGAGEMASEELSKLKKLVETTHQQGRILRFWATPDTETIWRELFVSGVDLLNTDQPGRLANWLREEESRRTRELVLSSLPWTPGPDIRPEVEQGKEGGTFRLHNQTQQQNGSVRQAFTVEEGRFYRFSAQTRISNVSDVDLSVLAKVHWRDAKGRRIGAPGTMKFADLPGPRRLEFFGQAPGEARQLVAEIGLRSAPGGSLSAFQFILRREKPLPERQVRAVTVHHRPRQTGSPEKSVEAFCRQVEAAAGFAPDLICLPEGITVVGTGKSYREVAESIPGPTSRRLGELARRLNSYLVAGIYEKTNQFIYNSALIIGRTGQVEGIYRKTHLPQEEFEGGLVEGADYPVFETDFGKIGILICWDIQFPEPARVMSGKGAEIFLVPIWGGSEILGRARAIENHAFFISSSFDMRSFIVSPSGEILAEATTEQPWSGVVLNLDRPILQPWLGDMKERTIREKRGWLK